MIYSADRKGPFKISGVYDPSENRLVGIIFRPDTWALSTVYYKHDDDNYDIVIPTVFTGYYYKVITPGKSGATEPAWETDGDITTDGTTGLTWQAVNYNLMPPTESILTVTYEQTNGVTLSNAANTSTSCQFLINELPDATIKSFQITAHVTKNNGEKFDVTLQFKVASR